MSSVTARPPAPDGPAAKDIRDFQSDTAELLGRPVPWRARATLHLIAAAIAAAAVLAGVVPIDRVVQARGSVISVQPTMLVQPLETSIIREIAVRDGQVVRKGDLLARLDPTFSTADLTRVEQQTTALAEEIARLSAELDGTPYAPARDGLHVTAQRALYASRKAEYEAALARYDEKIAGVEAEIANANKDIEFFRQRLVIFADVEKMRQTLEKKQAGSRLNALVATDNRVEMERNVVTNEGRIRAANHELAALRSERIVYLKQWRARLAQDLSDRQIALDAAREELAKATRRHDLIELRAVEDAVVLQVGSFSVGSVLQSGEKMMTLVPLDTAYEVEVMVEARDQGLVKVGDEVQLKFEAWPFVEHGSASGRVRTVSADSFTPSEQAGGQPYYVATVELIDTNLRRVPDDFRLVPGMPLTADIDVGAHTILSYLLNGALANLNEGFSEP
ncbi:HlyD family type I secretion periplasmic adaptor subunit [Chthonobacter albigriseus]|uniref:HlyD family type I secretion periplasmic adaptor subunit n=1 Tax=Chthonobacter albigriseus TaxID=1683161 RepID=UPI0015EFAFAB|nr:HlyD family type I secretion periplasmic adaptor subunit [Chthonobacter albigriseus]